MKVQLNETIKGIDGLTAIKDQEGKPLTIRDALISSILSPLQDDDQKLKYEKYSLYKTLRDAGVEVDLSPEDVVTLKKCVGAVQPALVLGQLFDALK